MSCIDQTASETNLLFDYQDRTKSSSVRSLKERMQGEATSFIFLDCATNLDLWLRDKFKKIPYLSIFEQPLKMPDRNWEEVGEGEVESKDIAARTCFGHPCSRRALTNSWLIPNYLILERQLYGERERACYQGIDPWYHHTHGRHLQMVYCTVQEIKSLHPNLMPHSSVISHKLLFISIDPTQSKQSSEE